MENKWYINNLDDTIEVLSDITNKGDRNELIVMSRVVVSLHKLYERLLDKGYFYQFNYRSEFGKALTKYLVITVQFTTKNSKVVMLNRQLVLCIDQEIEYIESSISELEDKIRTDVMENNL